MKKLLVLLSGLLLGIVMAHAQNIPQAQVPSVVLNAFKKEFPKASDIEWELKGEDYEVEFEIGFTDHEVTLDKTGKIIKHKHDIKQADLPQAIASAIAKDYAGYRASDFSKTISNGTTTYKLDLKKGQDEWEIVFDESGKILHKKAD